MSVGTISWTKLVPLTEQEAYERAGWEVAGCLNGTPHGYWSVIMKWIGDGEPVVPRATNGTHKNNQA